MLKPRNKGLNNKDNDNDINNKNNKKDDKSENEKLKKKIFNNNIKSEKENEKNQKENFSEANIKNNFNNNKALDNFQTFHMITANGDIYYLPADLSLQHADTNEELLLGILNNNFKKVLEFDYSEYEDRSTQFYEIVENWKKEYAKKSHDEYFTKEEKLQKEYSKYISNRDYAERNTQVTLKRLDGLDGTFVDNGYK